MRKYLKPILITISGLVVILLILPFLFKDRLIEEFKKTINANLQAQIEFKDLDVSLFKNFPNLSLVISDIQCTTYFYNDTSNLFQASEVQFGINIWNLIMDKDHIVVSNIFLIKPNFNIIQYDSTLANYNIFPKTKIEKNPSESALSFDIESYGVINGAVTFNDYTANLKMILSFLNHQGSFSNSEQNYKLESQTSIENIALLKNNISLLQKLKLVSNLNLNINLERAFFEIVNAEFKLNELNLISTGFISILGDSVEMDLNLSAPNNKFKELFSILPNALTENYNKVQANGNFNFGLSLNGVYNSYSKIYPSWKLNLSVENGFLKYPDKLLELENVQLKLLSENTGPNLNNAYIDLNTFSLLLNKQNLSGQFKMDKLTDNYNVVGNLNGLLNLADISNFYPLRKDMEISGKLDCDLRFNFTEQDINNKNYDKIDLTGKVNIDNLKYKQIAQPEFSILTAGLVFNSKSLNLTNSVIKIGHSDLAVSGEIKEPFNFLSENHKVSGIIFAKSNLFDVDEWMKPAIKNDSSSKPIKTNYIPPYVSKLNLDIQSEIKNLLFEDYKIENVTAKGFLTGDNLELTKFSGSVNENYLTGSGQFSGLYLYIMEDNELGGKIKIYSSVFDANKFMSSSLSLSNKSAEIKKSLNFIVPDNFNILVEFKSDQIVYKPLLLKNAEGRIHIIANDIRFENLSAIIAGGQFKMQGLYNTINPNLPYYNIKLDLLKLPFAEAWTSFTTLKLMAPVMQYIKGFFNANFILEGVLAEAMMPNLDSIRVDGYIETLDGAINGFKPLDQLANKFKIAELKNLNLKNTKNWISVSNGIVSLKEFTKKIADYEIKVVGNHKISGPMDYKIWLKIPKSKISKFTATINLDKTLEKLGGLLNKVGLESNMSGDINLLINIKGNVFSPEYNYKLVDENGKDSEGYEGYAESIKSKLKDSLTNRASEEFKNIKDKINDQVSKLEDSLSNEAMKKAEELKDKLIDKSKEQIHNQLDSNIANKVKESLDSISQKILTKEVKEVDQIKDKLKDWNPFKKEKK